MTAIACLKSEGYTYMACDSAAVTVSSHESFVTASPKIVKKENCLIGYTSSFRMGYLIQHSLKIPPIGKDLEYWANIDFIDALRSCLKDGGWLQTSEGREEGGCLILAVKDQIFIIDSDFQANRILGNHHGVGSGGIQCMASLATSEGLWTPRERLIKALEVTARSNITVREPFHIERIKHES